MGQLERDGWSLSGKGESDSFRFLSHHHFSRHCLTPLTISIPPTISHSPLPPSHQIILPSGNVLLPPSTKTSSSSSGKNKRVVLVSGDSALGGIEKGDLTNNPADGGCLVITLPQERFDASPVYLFDLILF